MTARPLALIALAALAGCSHTPSTWTGAGKAVVFEGPICGAETVSHFELSDMTDRSSANATLVCPLREGDKEAARVTLSTTDSSVSAVLEKQAEIISRQNQMIETLAKAGGAVAVP